MILNIILYISDVVSLILLTFSFINDINTFIFINENTSEIMQIIINGTIFDINPWFVFKTQNPLGMLLQKRNICEQKCIC